MIQLDLADAHRAGLHQAGDHGENHQAEHIVDHRRAEHDARRRCAEFAEIAEHATGDADRGGRQRGAEEQIGIGRLPRQQQRPDDEGAQGKGHDNADTTDGKRPPADLDQIGQPRFQADLQQQDDHAQFGDEEDDRVFGDGGEVSNPEQREITQHHAEQQFAEDGGKTEAARQRREQARAHQDEGQPQQVLANHAAAGRKGGQW